MSRQTVSAVASVRPRNSKLASLNPSSLTLSSTQIPWDSNSTTASVVGLHEVRHSLTVLRLNLAQSFPKHSFERLSGLVRVCLPLGHPSRESVFSSVSVLLPTTSLQKTVSGWSCCWRRCGLGVELSKIERRRWRRRHCLLRHLAAERSHPTREEGERDHQREPSLAAPSCASFPALAGRKTTPVCEVLVLRRPFHPSGRATHAPRPWK